MEKPGEDRQPEQSLGSTQGESKNGSIPTAAKEKGSLSLEYLTFCFYLQALKMNRAVQLYFTDMSSSSAGRPKDTSAPSENQFRCFNKF